MRERRIVAEKLPPQSIELEEAVLGALLLSSENIDLVMDILSPESFYKEQNGNVFKAIVELVKTKSPVDILTVTQKLKQLELLEFVGGSYYVSQLTNRVASSANVEYHARKIYEDYLKREIIRVSNGLIVDAYDHTTDCFELIDAAENFFKNLVKVSGSETKTTKDLVNEFEKEQHDLATKGDNFTSIGFKDVKLNLGNGHLVVLAGRPGMGKTAFMLSIILRQAELFKTTGEYVIVFSLEMTALDLFKRILSMLTGINSDYFKRVLGVDMFKSAMNVISDLEKLGILWNDKPSISCNYVRKTIKSSNKKGKKIKRVFIDYLQLMVADESKGNREQEISYISRNLKGIAKEFEIPVIALSQLSRKVEERAEKRPQLSDLRESGAIEQDADAVVFLYRAEYYKIEIEQINYNGLNSEYDTKGKCEVIISKNRHGDLSTALVGFVASQTFFYDLEIDEPEPIKAPTYIEAKLENNNEFLNQF